MVRPDDLDGLVALAAESSGLMTTMPRDRAGMEERLAEALQFDETYLFVLEEEGRIVGMSAMSLDLGRHRPFYNYKITHLTKTSPELNVRVDSRVLHPVNDYVGATELGTLFLHPDFRGDGRGRLLSWSRLMFMAVHRSIFDDIVMAELRGWTDPEGRSPFWDAIGNRFFTLDLSEADVLSGREYRFIADLLPTYPIYIDLLPADAQDVIGVPHDGSAPAMALLGKQGLRYRGYVDIFDAGPCIDTHIDDIDIVRNAVARPAATSAGDVATKPVFLANTGLTDFAVGVFSAATNDDVVTLNANELAALGRRNGDPIYVYEGPRR
ncbi:MAG: arginine N-succinyltransferase [Acidimicrobiales bacterium]